LVICIPHLSSQESPDSILAAKDEIPVAGWQIEWLEAYVQGVIIQYGQVVLFEQGPLPRV